MRAALIPLGAVLTACGTTQAVDPMASFKRQAVENSPVVRALAASNTFYFCSEHPDPDGFDALCEACDVDLFVDKDLPVTADPDQDAPIVGLKVFATHFYHEYQPWGEVAEPRIKVSGERGAKSFRTTDITASGAREIFEQGNAWCRARGEGEFVVRKDEIDTYFVERVTNGPT